MHTTENYFQRFNRLDDHAWVELVIRSVAAPVIDSVRFPGFPPTPVQAAMVGSSGEHALIEASLFYREIKAAALTAGLAFGQSTRILDFGCGYGRHYRFFLKDVPQENILGVDLDPDFIRLCQETIPGGSFLVNRPFPPIELPSASQDLIYAFSVFSHLNEAIGLAWVREFARLLRPGGLLVVTTHSRNFIRYCAGLRREPQDQPWQIALAELAFVDEEATQRDYEAGRHLYAPTGGGGPRTQDIYGEALLSPNYIQSRWIEYLDLVDFVDDPRRLPQALIIMRQKESERSH